jgi:3-isopropylmalate dehydratase small subunit
MIESEKTFSDHYCNSNVIQIGIGRMTQSKQKGERKLMKKTPKQKTSIYIDKEHIQTIQEMKDKYNLSVNRTINLCLKNYLPEIQEGKCVLWI